MKEMRRSGKDSNLIRELVGGGFPEMATSAQRPV